MKLLDRLFPVGTRSLLFGVHQFLWHPVTVALGYRALYGRWPNLVHWVAIFLHDIGYWGKPNMDGQEGKLHPELGALWTFRVIYAFGRLRGHSKDLAFVIALNAMYLALCHSRDAARSRGRKPSELCWADKLAVHFDPEWFYLLRGRLSGEIREFKQNAGGNIPADASDRFWLRWYKAKVLQCPDIKNRLGGFTPRYEKTPA